MAQARDSPTEKRFSYRSLLLLFGVPLIMYIVFNEALMSVRPTETKTSVRAGQTSIRGHQAQNKTNIAQLQTSNIQLKADLDALTNKQNALMKKYEEDKEEQTQMSIVSAAVCLSGSEYLPNHMFIAKDFGNLETTCEAMSRQFGFTATAQCVARMQPYASIMAAFGCCDGKIIHFSVFFFLCRI